MASTTWRVLAESPVRAGEGLGELVTDRAPHADATLVHQASTVLSDMKSSAPVP